MCQKTFAAAKVQQNFEICKKNQKNDIFEAKNLEISRKSCIFAAYFEETNQSQIFLSRYRLFVRVTMDEARFEHPLSTLSASIEHPLEPGGDQVETTWRKGKGIYLKIIVVIVTVTA